MKKYKFLSAVVFTALLGVSSNTIASTAVFNGSGDLVGLNGVNVSTFGIFDLTFHNTWQGNLYGQSFSAAAGAAIFNEFTGSGSKQGGSIDYSPSLAVGCEGAIVCGWKTVYLQSGTNVVYGSFANWNQTNDSWDNFSNSGSTSLTNALNDSANTSWVDWQPSNVSAVPIPAAAFMFAPALLGFLGFRRKLRA